MQKMRNNHTNKYEGQVYRYGRQNGYELFL